MIIRKNQSERTDFGPGKWNLYHNNKGLFSDPYLDERLPNIKEYPNTPGFSFIENYWNVEENDPQFLNIFNNLRNLYKENYKNFSKYLEAQLEDEWVKPILKLLGWEWTVQDSYTLRGKNNRPDYTMFASKEDKQKAFDCGTGNHKFKYAKAVADAKAWNIDLNGTGNTKDNPSYQIVRYMEDTKSNWGILTNGQFWRIYSLKTETRHNTYYEIDLDSILSQDEPKRFKYFYNFFRKSAFTPYSSSSEKCFLDLVYEDGQYYAINVEKKLKTRAFEVVEKLCNGFLDHNKNYTDEQLKKTYEHSLYYLFKLMFVFNCESRGLLNVSNTSDYYPHSLRKLCLDLLGEHNTSTTWGNSSKTYMIIQSLFSIISEGDSDIGIHSFGNEIFESGDINFYFKNKNKDKYINDALVHLSTSKDENNTLLFIDFKRVSPDHLGSIFEGLLEFDLVKGDNSFELLNNKGERKPTGAYYTPSHIVDYIVEETIGKLVVNKSIEDILSLKICDPAMGSGHFLIGTVKFLENKILSLQDEDPENAENLEFNEIKWHILHNCIHGVDINPIAVELAKLSLWIYTADKEEELECLSNIFKIGNSLDSDLFEWKNHYKDVFDLNNGFDAIIGNPPYDVMEKDRLNQVHPHKLLVEKLRIIPEYEAATGGKLNLYRFFLVKAHHLLKPDGQFGMIIPMSLVADISCKNVRKFILNNSRDIKIDCFPQKDDRNNRVFEDAKLSTCVVTYSKSENATKDVMMRTMPGAQIINTISFVKLKLSDIKKIDSDSWCIPMVDKYKWKVLSSLYNKLGIVKLKDINGLNINRGEINQSTFKKYITASKSKSTISMLKGAAVGQYQIREKMSQGIFEFFDEKKYLSENPNIHPKSRIERIATQRVNGVDERLRVVASIVAPPVYLADSTNSITLDAHCKLSKFYLLALLNSTLYQWRFKLTSSNNNIGTNELELMPIKDIDFSNKKDVKIYSEIIKLAENLTNQNYQDSSKIKPTQDRIEQLIITLFDLNDADIETIYENRFESEIAA